MTIVSMAHDAQLLASGRTADVYSYGDGASQVLKLFKPQGGRGAAEHEHRIAHAVFACGANTPEPGTLVEVGGRVGMVYQRIAGRTLLSIMQRRPWRIVPFARLMAELHVEMHRRTPTGLPSYREVIAERLTRIRELDAGLRESALLKLDALPGGAQLCHGDFHPDNIMLTPERAMVIDWNDAYAGPPLSDVARTSLLLRSSPPTNPTPGLRVLLAVRRIFHDVYLKRYLKLTGLQEAQLRPFARVSAIARLADGIPGEREVLLREIGL